MREFEFIVTGRIVIAAHCMEDAEQAVKDSLDDTLTDYDAVCVG